MSDAMAQIRLWGGLSIAAVSYILLQSDMRREALNRADRRGV
ncbi:hypothetical protein [Qipengyuania sediminis]|nr:hypothetical protein [Qipengyuania sediminis]